jgi:hypothetical protein
MADKIYYAREYGWYSRWKVVSAGMSISADDPTPRTMYCVSSDSERAGAFKRGRQLFYTRDEALAHIRKHHPDLIEVDPDSRHSPHSMYVRW